mgnify:CR=1 FL=1
MTQNQVHNPRPKKVRVDSQGNDKRRLFLKDGQTTMLFHQGLTENSYRVLIHKINDVLVSMGRKALPNSRFLITR